LAPLAVLGATVSVLSTQLEVHRTLLADLESGGAGLRAAASVVSVTVHCSVRFRASSFVPSALAWLNSYGVEVAEIDRRAVLPVDMKSFSVVAVAAVPFSREIVDSNADLRFHAMWQ
jgi:hypothetical protein